MFEFYMLFFVYGVRSYDIVCPETPHRNLRANALCPVNAKDKYSCTFDTNKKIYKEYCNETADYSAPGEKYVLTGIRRNIECDKCRFQPYSLWSNESSLCQFLKSSCSGEGQIVYNSNSSTVDTSCRCDYRRGYDFVVEPKYRCYCRPLEEDCSCYVRKCFTGYQLDADAIENGLQIIHESEICLCQDYNCTYPGGTNSSMCSQIILYGIDDKNKSQNNELEEIPYKESNSMSAVVMVIVGIIASLVILIGLSYERWLYRKCRKPACIRSEKNNERKIQDFQYVAETIVGEYNIYLCQAMISTNKDNFFVLVYAETINSGFGGSFKFYNHAKRTKAAECTRVVNDTLKKGIGKDVVTSMHQRRNHTNHGIDKNAKRLISAECDTDQLVVAVDLGTTLSGYAFSSTKSFGEDPLKIDCNRYWESGSGGLVSIKTPTSVLLQTNGECLAFGYDAENDYIDRMLEDDDTDCLFFHRFKMALYKSEDITDNWEIKDINGKLMSALNVFSSALAKLKEYAENHIKTIQPNFHLDAIQWVVTVPAIWTEKAKDFMRKSAEKAGMQKEKLLIALEPESVSVYFQYLNTYQPQQFPGFSDYDILHCEYLVIDIGGGTVEITSHKSDNGVITELCKPSGSDWGSTMIDNEFIKLIESIVGKEVLESLKRCHTQSYFDILRTLEKLKQKIFLKSTKSKTHEFFKYPHLLEDLYKQKTNETIEEAVQKSKYSKSVSVKMERFRISKTIIQDMFLQVIKRVIDNIQSVLEDLRPNEVSTFLVVGGLTLSPILEKELKISFPNVNVIIPNEADMVVAKGAVLFGHGPNFIVSRIAQYTYGRIVQPLFDKQKHDRRRCITIDGNERCNDVFDILVKKGQQVKVGETIRKEYETLVKRQKQLKITVFITKKDKVEYIDEEGCKLLCEVEVLLPVCLNRGKRCIAVDFEFGNTEFKVTAFEKETNKLCEVTCALR